MAAGRAKRFDGGAVGFEAHIVTGDPPGIQAPQPARQSAGWRTAFSVTLTMSMAVSPFALVALSSLSPMVVPELGLSRLEFGSVGFIAYGVAAATSVAGGRRVAAFGGRAMLLWVFATAGAAAVVVVGAQSLRWLWTAALFVGVGQALANPVTNHLIAEHIPTGRQGTQIGVKQSGVPLAQAVIGLALPPVAVVVGWRASMLAGVLLAVIGMAAVWAVIPAPAPMPRRRTFGGKPPVHPLVRWLTIYSFSVATTTTAVLFYVPLYSFERLGMAPSLAGMAIGVLGTSGVASRILWSRITERRDAAFKSLTALPVIALGSVALILLSEYLGPWMLWTGVVGFGFSALAANAVVMLSVIRLSGPGQTGHATGMVGLGLFLGFMVGPVGFGALVDWTESYTAAWCAVAFMSAVALGTTTAWRQGTHSATGR